MKKTRKLLLPLFAALILCFGFVFASAADEASLTGSCGADTVYSFTPETGVLEISGSGQTDDYYQSISPWDGFKGEITELVVKPGVTSIGYKSFSGCSDLQKITLPASLESIGQDAFYTYPKAAHTDVYFDGGLSDWLKIDIRFGSNSNPLNCGETGNLYFNGELVQDIVLPEGLEALGAKFYNCDSLKTVKTNSDLKSINGSFSGCSSLEKIELNDGLLSIGGDAFRGCVSLREIKLPDSLEKIGEALNGLPDNTNYVFAGCNSLEEIEIPAGVEGIPNSCFYFCDNLKRVKMNGGTVIRKYAFYSCKKLEQVELPDGLAEINDAAFDYCESLGEINLPESVTTLGSSAFGNCGLKRVFVPGKITELGTAFSNCKRLEEAVLSKSLQVIGKEAFGYCDSLKQVIFLSDGVQFNGDPFYQTTAPVTVFCKSTVNVPTAAPIKTVNFEISNGKLSFSGQGSLEFDLYELFGLIADIALGGNDEISEVHFDSFTLKKAEGYSQVNYRITGSSRPVSGTISDGDVLENVTFSAKIGEKDYSFNEIFKRLADATADSFTLEICIGEKELETEVSVTDRISAYFERLAKAIVTLLNKLLDLFRRLF